MHKNLIKYFKYCAVGGLGVVIDFTIFASILYTNHINYLISNIVSFTCATSIVCYLQKNWTFQYHTNKKLDMHGRYLFSILIIYIFNNILLIIFIELLHIGQLNSKVMQILLSSIIGYFIQNFFVFNKECSVN